VRAARAAGRDLPWVHTGQHWDEALSEAVNALLKSEGRAPVPAAKAGKRAAKRTAKKRPARPRKAAAAPTEPEAPAASEPAPKPARRAAKRKTA
jgi:hypothetical protein